MPRYSEGNIFGHLMRGGKAAVVAEDFSGPGAELLGEVATWMNGGDEIWRTLNLWHASSGDV